MTEVLLERSLLADVEISTPATGPVKADYELVTNIHIENDHISVHAPDWQSAHEVARLETLRQEMPAEMAKRLIRFCSMTFCSDDFDYDCHTFTSFMMGWQDNVTAGTSGMALSRKPLKDTDATESNRPYVAYSPTITHRYLHSFLGTDRPGYGLGVLGPGMPIVMGRTSDLMRTYGASTLYSRKH